MRWLGSRKYYFEPCARIADAIADFKRFCAWPYAAKSPLASAACASFNACCAALRDDLSEEFDEVELPVEVELELPDVPPLDDDALVPALPPKT